MVLAGLFIGALSQFSLAQPGGTYVIREIVIAGGGGTGATEDG